MAEKKMGGVTRDISDKIVIWNESVKRVERLNSDLSQARYDSEKSEKNLLNSLVPKDAKPGEVFSIWCNDDEYEYLISARVDSEIGGEKHGVVSVRSKSRVS